MTSHRLSRNLPFLVLPVLVLMLAVFAAPFVAFSAKAAELGGNGLHVQPFFQETFLSLEEDLADAKAQGKRLMVIWEQKGCPYCKQLHTETFEDAELREMIEADFYVVQMDLWGSREAADFDGTPLPERDLAAKYGVIFTPTIQFFPASQEEIGEKTGQAAEAFRLPGFFRPFHFKSAMVFVRDDHYKTTNFQRYVVDGGYKGSR